MAKKKQRDNPAEEFSRFYEDLYPDRWEALRESMLADPRYFTLSRGLMREYYLDEASVIAGRYLEARAEHSILDLCAAPGGKTLVILSGILSGRRPGAKEPGDGLWPRIDYCANERSASRRGRLKKVIAEHLPGEVAGQILITGHDAGRWGMHQSGRWDRIMLDVPCSSERHVIQDPKYLAQWSPGRSIRLAQQAYSFVLSALMALKPGGSLVYSTCALSTGENDGVIDRVLTRILKKGDMAVMTDNRRAGADGTPLPDWVEDTKLGFAILPDRAEGRGPMYFSRLKKL